MQLDPLLVLKRLATGYDIKCLRVAAPFAGLEDFDYGLRKALDSQFDWEAFGKLLIENTAEHGALSAHRTCPVSLSRTPAPPLWITSTPSVLTVLLCCWLRLTAVLPPWLLQSVFWM